MKTQSWDLLGCLLFVFLFMCICLFEKDKSWQATKFDGRPIKHLSKTCERSTDWRRQWHLKGFVHITIFDFSFFVHINTLIFSVYLVHYPSFLYIYWGVIKRKCTKKRKKKFWFFAYSLYIGMVYNAEVSQNSSKLRIEKCFQVF